MTIQSATQPASGTTGAAGLRPEPTPPVPGLSPEWQDWLVTNIVNGCVDNDLVETMAGAGFERQFARIAIGVSRGFIQRVPAEMQAAALYKADPIRLKRGNRIVLPDRTVHVGFTLENPNIAALADLLSHEECEELMALAQPRLTRSAVVDRQSGKFEVIDARTSDGMYFQRGENPLVARIEKRIEALTGIPAVNGEGVQVLRYGPSDEYRPHHDYFEPTDPGSASHLAVGGQRIATVVMYLNDVDEGGETFFPDVELGVKPRQGAAAYFEYHNAAGQIDPRLLHAGTPVVRGVKWIATKWMRERRYGA
jgi:prolyl 4-hydroxylase